jgi:hypothetical protein
MNFIFSPAVIYLMNLYVFSDSENIFSLN